MQKCGGACFVGLFALMGFAGTICCIAYLSIALDHEPVTDVACPSKVRDWTIGFLSLMCLNLAVVLTGANRSEGNSNPDSGGVMALVSLGSFVMSIAGPVVIDKELQGVCPDTKYEDAFEVVFWYYVTANILVATIVVAACVVPCAMKACSPRDSEAVTPRTFL